MGTALGLPEPLRIERIKVVSDDPDLGGLSGIEMADDGLSYVALSDRGFLVRAQITRDATGAISAIAHDPVTRLITPRPNGVTTRDSEGLVVTPEGAIFISFEGTHRVAQFPNLAAMEATLPSHPEFAGFQPNSGLESLAIDADGVLYALPERSGRYDRPFPIFRFQDGQWDVPYVLPRVGSFLVVGADFGPDGMLYVLERDFTGFSFLNRVRCVDLQSGEAYTVFVGTGQYGNLEGISVWRDSPETLRLTMVSDDNYNMLQQTEIVELQIKG
jgi:hypothetical protein